MHFKDPFNDMNIVILIKMFIKVLLLQWKHPFNLAEALLYMSQVPQQC